MIKLHWDDAFAKKLKKLIGKDLELHNLIKNRLELLSYDPFHQSLRTHKILGKLNKYYASSIDYKYRILYRFIDKDNILSIDIGTHDEVY